jgi:hypothetical protein
MYWRRPGRMERPPNRWRRSTNRLKGRNCRACRRMSQMSRSPGTCFCWRRADFP